MKNLTTCFFLSLFTCALLAQNCLLVPNQYDEFNGAAAIDGNTAILSDQDYSVGSIKIFSESNGVWSVDQIVNNPDTNTIAFGFFDVDLSGDYAIVSADNTAFFLKKDSGSGIWNVQQQVFHDNPSSYTLFGRDVKIDGDIAIVSAERDSELNSNVGAVFVYKRDSNDTWNQVQKIYPSSQDGNNYFGSEIDLVGSRLIAKSRFNSYLNNQDAVYVFEEDVITGGWVEKQIIEEPVGIGFISTIALNSSQLVISGIRTYFYELDGSGDFVNFQTVEINSLVDISDTRAAFSNEDYDFNSTTSMWEFAQVRNEYLYKGEILGDKLVGSGRFYSCDTDLCYARLNTYTNNFIVCSDSPEQSFEAEFGGGTGPFTMNFDTDGDGIADDIRTGIINDSLLLFSFTGTTNLTLVSALDESNNNFMCSVTGSILFNFVDQPDLIPIGTLTNTCPEDFVDLTALTYTDNNPVSAADTNAYYQYRYMNSTSISDPDKVCESGFVVISKYSNGCIGSDTVYVDLQDCGISYCKPNHTQLIKKTSNPSISASGEFMIVGQQNVNASTGIATLYHQNTDGTWLEIEEFEPTEGAVSGTDYDLFGKVVSIDGDYMAISAHGDDDQGGAVYVYEKSGSTFVFAEKILGGSNFGNQLKLRGDQLLVGNTSGFGASLFERSATGSWDFKQSISVGSYRLRFGLEMDFKDDIISIYSGHNNYNDSIYVFEKNGSGIFDHTQSIPSPETTNYSYFGQRTAISNNRIAATIPRGVNKNVYIYEKNASGVWINLDTIPIDGLQSGNDLALVDDTLFVGAQRYIDHFIFDGTDWDFKKRYGPREAFGGNANWIDYENGNLWAARSGNGVQYLTCSDYDCYAEFAVAEYQFCNEAYYDVPLRVEVSIGKGPYTIEIDTTGDGLADWTVNNYYSGSPLYQKPIGVDTFTYELVSVLDEGSNSAVCRLGLGAKIIVHPTPDLAPVPPQINSCPNTTFDLTAVTLVDNNPLSSGFAAEYIYTLVGNSTPISDPTDIQVDGLYKITKKIGNCFDEVEFLVDIISCPGELCNLQKSGIFYPDSLASGYHFGHFEFDGTTVVSRKRIQDFNLDKKFYIYEKDAQGIFNFQDTLVYPGGNSWGASSDVSGDYIAIGDRTDSDLGSVAGAVYIYKKDSGSGLWNFDSKIYGSDTDNSDQFGANLAFDGDKLAVVSRRFDSGVYGAVYIFELNSSGAWVEIDKAVPSAGHTNNYGTSIDFDGDFIAVGDNFYSNGNPSNSGAISLFKNGGGNNWVSHQTLTASVPTNFDLFGFDVAIENGTLFTGAPGNDTNGNGSGATYVFEENASGQYVETQIIYSSTPSSGYGRNVSISGDRIVAAENNNDVYVYHKPTTTWELKQQISTAPSGSYNIESCEIENDDLLVGTYTATTSNLSSGMIRTYSCESPTCSATIYQNRAACYTSASMRFEAFSGLGPYTVELDAGNDGIADVVYSNLQNYSTISLNITQETTFTLLSAIDEGTGNEVCDVYGQVTLTNFQLDPGVIGLDQQICSGDNASILSFTTLPSALNGYYLIRWYKKTGNTNWTIVQTNGTTYDPGVLTQTAQFRCQVFANAIYGVGCSKYTEQIEVFVGDVTSPEICDGLDNDCNGLIDDGLTLFTYYQDLDNDTYGNINVSLDTCLMTPPNGWVSDNTDCNDSCNSCFPGAIDYCNNIDEDCDGIAMENCICPDIKINSIVIDTMDFNLGRIDYTAELENVGSDTVFMSQRGIQHYYSDDNIISNGDEFGAGGWGSSVFVSLLGIDTVLVGEVFSYSFYSSSGYYFSDPTPHMILDITGFDCVPSNDIDIVAVSCPSCLFCDYDIAIINNDIVPVDTLSDYKWSANQHVIMDGKVLAGSGADTFVDMTAGDYIILNPGFESELGTRAHYYIAPCDPSQLPFAPPEEPADTKAKAVSQDVEGKLIISKKGKP